MDFCTCGDRRTDVWQHATRLGGLERSLSDTARGFASRRDSSLVHTTFTDA